MGLNWFERQCAKAGWRLMEGKVKGLRTWAPVIGSSLLVAVVALRALGYTEAASAVEGLGGAVGITEQSPVGLGELTAAGAALTGIVLKLRSAVRKARGLA